MKHAIIAAAVTLAWVASVVFLPFLTHHAKYAIITANAVALGGDTPTWLIAFAEFIGSWLFGGGIVVGGYAVVACLWMALIGRGGR